MSELSNLSYPEPLARVKDNISIYANKSWNHFIVDYREPLAPSTALVVDMVPLAVPAVTAMAANGAIAKALVAILQVDDHEFCQFRSAPLDNIEYLLWIPSGGTKEAKRNVHVRMSAVGRFLDPYRVGSEFTVLGQQQRDMNLEVRNPTAVAQPSARIAFWGHRYELSPWDYSGVSEADKAAMAKGDRKVVQRIMGGPTTWVSSEAML